MKDSQQLLADYVANRSETAFRELVNRYVDLVHSTAVRLVDGDAHRAKDVTQLVFADLARKAGQLSPHSMLGGWLHRHTCFVARTVMRGERRRQARERQAMELSALDNQADAALSEIAAVLDEAINELGADDRDAILLRFFEHRHLRSVGEALGTSENVAQKRVARAVQELAALLRRRGYAVPAAALAAGLAAGAVKAAPAGMALGIAATVCGNAGATAPALAKAAGTAKLTSGVFAAVVVVGGLTALLLHRQPKATVPDTTALMQRPQDQAALITPAEPEPAAAEPPRPAPLLPQPQPIRVPSAEPIQPIPVSAPVAADLRQPVEVPVPVPEPPIAGPAPSGRRLFVAKSGSKVTIHGTANILHTSWLVESSFIGGVLEVGPDFPTAPGQQATPGRVDARARIFVRVRSLKSVEEDGRPYSDRMDDIMYQQLKEERFKQITYKLQELTLKEVPKFAGEPYVYQARGELAIAGVTNKTTMMVSILPVAAGQERKLEITGKTIIRTTDYNVRPVDVNLVLGHIRTGENVALAFKWVVGERKLAANLSTADRRDFENIAPGAKLTCSDSRVSANDLTKVTDGDREASDANILFLRKGTQWVQMDLGRPRELFAVAIWHAYDLPKVFHDVIVQASNDPAFRKNVQTLFNNDLDNSSGRGVGADQEYRETAEGMWISAEGIEARYLRFYSKGSTESALNEYTEIEVYGRPER